jgi:hypothetical protein
MNTNENIGLEPVVAAAELPALQGVGSHALVDQPFELAPVAAAAELPALQGVGSHALVDQPFEQA